MPTLYLLDTNILIAAMKGHPTVRQHLENTPLEAIRLSTIVLGELAFGVEKSAYAERNQARLETLTSRLPVVGVAPETAHAYGRIRAHLERQGKPIGANDFWIAAQALSVGATLVTDNQKEFRRVEGLSLANWLA